MALTDKQVQNWIEKIQDNIITPSNHVKSYLHLMITPITYEVVSGDPVFVTAGQRDKLEAKAKELAAEIKTYMNSLPI